MVKRQVAEVYIGTIANSKVQSKWRDSVHELRTNHTLQMLILIHLW
jgi:hypothetical protein